MYLTLDHSTAKLRETEGDFYSSFPRGGCKGPQSVPFSMPLWWWLLWLDWCLHQIRCRYERGVRRREVGPPLNPVPIKLTWKGGSAYLLLVFSQQKSHCLTLNEKHDFLIIVKRGKGKKEQAGYKPFICKNWAKMLPPERAGCSEADGREAEASPWAWWRQKSSICTQLPPHHPFEGVDLTLPEFEGHEIKDLECPSHLDSGAPETLFCVLSPLWNGDKHSTCFTVSLRRRNSAWKVLNTSPNNRG